jgi:hypothetical protein
MSSTESTHTEPSPSDQADRASRVPVRTLEKWAAERLAFREGEGGCTTAVFHFEGSTCMNSGEPFAFVYEVELGPASDGYPIRAMRCRPADGDEGHAGMCRYVAVGEDLLREIEHDQPLLGHPLNDVLTWSFPETTSGCYCQRHVGLRKWGLVLSTIHYALTCNQDYN